MSLNIWFCVYSFDKMVDCFKKCVLAIMKNYNISLAGDEDPSTVEWLVVVFAPTVQSQGSSDGIAVNTSPLGCVKPAKTNPASQNIIITHPLPDDATSL